MDEVFWYAGRIACGILCLVPILMILYTLILGMGMSGRYPWSFIVDRIDRKNEWKAMTTPTPMWVRTYENGIEFLEHRDGIEWGDAPLPPRWHRCKVQTQGVMSKRFVRRCACGGVSFGATMTADEWIERNTRRRGRKGHRYLLLGVTVLIISVVGVVLWRVT